MKYKQKTIEAFYMAVIIILAGALFSMGRTWMDRLIPPPPMTLEVICVDQTSDPCDAIISK